MNERYLANIKPSLRQYEWQKLEFYGFIHFGMNTMTGREWGTGTESPASFNPGALDARQWVAALASAGMSGVILTAKHHDGFCLWPSRYTTHSVASSPWRDGNGDVVAEVAAACQEFGIKLGIYLSPWDMAEPTYGTGTAYDDFFVNQLTELLTGYGDIFCVWLDGANGEGAGGKIQTYDWERYYRTIRGLAPQAVISVCGPDVRWCGNEAGHTRVNEWSVVDYRLRSAELTASKSQQVDDRSFAQLVNSGDDDLGSRSVLPAAPGELVWYPAEVNTSIRPGWFYHEAEDSQVRSSEELFEIYLRSVGGNSTFLLNVPPDARGQIHVHDAAELAQLGELVTAFKQQETDRKALWEFSSNPRGATGEQLASLRSATEIGSGFGGGEMGSESVGGGGYWQPAHDDLQPSITVSLPRPAILGGVVLKEQITVGQRIERVVISALIETPGHTPQEGAAAGWEQVAQAGAVGYQRVLRFAPIKAHALKVEILASRGEPTISSLVILPEAYGDPLR